MQAPSIKAGLTLLIVVLLTTSIITYSSSQKKQTSTKEVFKEDSLKIAVDISSQENTKDTDGDDLNDWEEILWGTDINNPDSDGDGTKDGAEVVLGRNPNKAGPDDLFVKVDSFSEDLIKIESKIDPDTITAKTSVELAKQVFNKQLNKGEISIEEIISNAQSEIKISQKYDAKNLLIISNSTQEDIRNYGNNFATVYKEEILKMANSLDKSVDMFVAGYKNLSLRMSAIRVPQEIANIHNEFINNIDLAADIIKVISESNEDPVKSYLFLPKYNEASDKIVLQQKQIELYLNNSGIIFNEDEPGYILFGGKSITETQND